MLVSQEGKRNHGNVRRLTGHPLTKDSAAREFPGRPPAKGKSQRRERRPGVLVGVGPEHLHGHQHWRAGAGVGRKAFVSQLLRGLHFAEVDLDKRQDSASPPLRLRRGRSSPRAPPTLPRSQTSRGPSGPVG